LRSSTIGEDDAASLKRALLGILAARTYSGVPGDLVVEFPKAIGPKYPIRLLDIANTAAAGDSAGRPGA